MKLKITKEDIRQAILQYSGIDIENNIIDIEIEGYVKIKDLRLKVKSEELPVKEESPMTVITDSNMNVLDIKKPEKDSSNTLTKVDGKRKKRKGKARNQYTGRVHYEEYETEVLDFATSTDKKRKLPTFGLTLACIKERYKATIKKCGVQDMIRFGQIDSEPYLIRK